MGQSAKCRDCGAEIRVPVPAPPVEESPSGSPILRHEDREREFEVATGDEETIDAITAHIDEHIGEIDQVWHELISDLVHIDVHQVPPSEDRPFWTFVTSGMSDKPMTVPEGAEDFAYAELMICLPPDWPVGEKDFDDENNYWPVRLLKVLARLPHEYETWLGPGHTVPNGGEDPAPYADNNSFVCALMLSPGLVLPSEVSVLELSDGRIINFYAVWPMHQCEVDLKLKRGLDALLNHFEKHQVNELLDLNRPAIEASKPWWKFWG
ncbi:MAG: suppressor of fused domain protein [Planctomycetales bacterium]